MGIYIAEFFCVLLLGMLFNAKIVKIRLKNKEQIFLKIVFFMLFLVMALREPHLGTDSWMYGNIYERVGRASSLQEAFVSSTIDAPLYVAICRLLSYFFPNRQALIIVSAAAVLLGFYNYIKRESKDYSTSSLLFLTLVFYFQSFNGTRQFIAIALLLNAYSYWSDDIKNYKGWICYAAAVLIHSTAFAGIIFLLLQYGGKKRASEVGMLIRGAVITSAAVFGQTLIISLFLRLFPQYSKYFFGSNGHSFFDAYGQGRQIIIYVGYLIILIYALIQIRSTSKIENYANFHKQYNLMLMAALLGITGSKSWAINRINFYFTSVAICFIPNALLISKRYRQVNNAVRILTVMLTAMYCYIYLSEDKAGIVPYSFFWQ